MRDDLFEFLATQETGVLYQNRGRPPEQPTRAGMCGPLRDKQDENTYPRKGQVSVSRACLIRFGVSELKHQSDRQPETPDAVWDSVDTLERFQARPILQHHIDHVTRTLHWNQDTNELVCEQCYRNVGESRIYRVAGSELLDWILDANEDHLIELPETGHVCISLPAQLKERIAQVAAAENRSFKDWVVSRLSEAVEDEPSRASLAQAAARMKRLKELFEQMKLRAPPPSS